MNHFPSNSKYLSPQIWSRYQFELNLIDVLLDFVIAYFYFYFQRYSITPMILATTWVKFGLDLMGLQRTNFL